jgi:tetratricopeptide (TPR) repeat protein
MKKLLPLLLAAALVLTLAACSGKDNKPGDYKAFTKAMTDMKAAGDQYAEKGLTLGAQSCYAFAGASLSSLRYAVENILWLKGEGDSIEAVTEGSRYAGWNEIAAVCYASPYPYYFEGLLFQVQGKNDEAEPCYTAALMNPAYPDNGVDFYYLKDMEVADLYKLRDELREKENEVYTLITQSPVTIERDQYSFFPEYLRVKSEQALESGDNTAALAYAKAAVINDSLDPLNYTSAVLCAIAAGDLDAAGIYLDAGLLIDPEDEGLNQILSAFASLAGDE